MKITDQEFDQLWNSGMPRDEIGKVAGLSGSAVSKRAKRRGLAARPHFIPTPPKLYVRRKRKPCRCRCQNPNCQQVYFANPNPPIQPHECAA